MKRKLEGIAQKIMRKMQEQGRVTTLSNAQAYDFDNRLALGLIPIKQDFYKKHRNSREYISQIENTTAEN